MSGYYADSLLLMRATTWIPIQCGKVHGRRNKGNEDVSFDGVIIGIETEEEEDATNRYSLV